MFLERERERENILMISGHRLVSQTRWVSGLVGLTNQVGLITWELRNFRYRKYFSALLLYITKNQSSIKLPHIYLMRLSLFPSFQYKLHTSIYSSNPRIKSQTPAHITEKLKNII